VNIDMKAYHIRYFYKFVVLCASYVTGLVASTLILCSLSRRQQVLAPIYSALSLSAAVEDIFDRADLSVPLQSDTDKFPCNLCNWTTNW
jgi:hypothetical protein